ncbi:MAG: class I SAM-dependent methyltransferase [Pyrinomonadaceae bacterium]
MNESIEFFQAFLKNPLKVGAIAPSSLELSTKMLDGVIPDKNGILIELGPGTGAFTKQVYREHHEAGSYLGIELDRKLITHLRSRYPSLKFVWGNATKAFKIHERSELGNARYIISGLPFVSLPNDVNLKIYEEIEKFMEKGCMFRTFQYAHGYYMPSAVNLRKFMRTRYGVAEKSSLIIKNVPPAVTLTWSTLS